ncbi:MAG: penicillin-binding protein activator LpoB, partial [Gemmatimonadetes bacterium]|nr:penicillin-binding protein activator LpoB [Gemmatimonadota bacterium]NIQ54651.1 penicillin-binding protein activator LpoB [Gemmatimonadota bacterium]NIU74860.1 penicillin-binding protein activator LpoB [Gammaproteobacteria bacterium]NIX44752.1 penicillin-binding protein activator LpoB [Gemmatimonadota bacterium]NIY08997.1 penicillin-binding protein activator LpoB [Gemmatimonadota bacterium]
MNRSGRAIAALVLAVFAVGAGACGKRVSRIDPSSVTDLSGRWNDTDSRLVANELITQSLNAPWVTRYTTTHGGEPPAVIVGTFSNRTLEHIPVNTFISDLERAMINSGAVRMVASPEERAEIRAEREDQQDNARAGTRARMAYELGANYMLQGEITAIEDEEGREQVVFYQVDATLTDLESNVKVWAGQHKIKKYIERP